MIFQLFSGHANAAADVYATADAILLLRAGDAAAIDTLAAEPRQMSLIAAACRIDYATYASRLLCAAYALTPPRFSPRRRCRRRRRRGYFAAAAADSRAAADDAASGCASSADAAAMLPSFHIRRSRRAYAERHQARRG